MYCQSETNGKFNLSGGDRIERKRLAFKVELAEIDGRDEFNEGDWAEAKRELHGGHEQNDTNGEMDMTVMISGHDMVRSSMGHHASKVGYDDQDNMAEELIAEGMDEAVHEQMLAARKERDEEDAEDEDEER